MNLEKLLTDDQAKRQAVKFAQWVNRNGWTQAEKIGKWKRPLCPFQTTEQLYDKMMKETP